INSTSEFENLLINCQLLTGLVIDIVYDFNNAFSWDKFFEILTKSSPISLFKFRFSSSKIIKLEYLQSFFDNWKDRNPLLLEVSSKNYMKQQLEDLTKT